MSFPAITIEDLMRAASGGVRGRPDVGMTLSNALARRKEEEDRARQRAFEDERRRDHARNQYLSLIESGVDPKTAAQVTNVDQGFEGIGKVAHKRYKENESERERIRSEQQITSITPTLQNVLDAASSEQNLESLPEDVTSLVGIARLAELQGRYGQDVVSQALARASAAARSNTAARTDVIEGERRRAQLSESMAIRSERRALGREIAGETRAQAQGAVDTIIRGTAQSIVLGQTDAADPTAVRDQLSRLPGMTGATLDRTLDRVMIEIEQTVPTLLAQAASATGDQPEVRAAELRFDLWKDQFGEGVLNNHGLTRRHAETVERGIAFLDPVAAAENIPLLVPAQDSADARKQRQSRLELSRLSNSFDQLEDAYEALGSAIESGRVLPTPMFDRDMLASLSRTGLLSAEQSTFLNATLFFPSYLLKSVQGSRPSDFDFKNFLALAPLPAEVGTQAGDAKMRYLRTMIDDQLSGPLSKEGRAQLSAVKRRTSNPKPDASDAALEGALEQINLDIERTGVETDEHRRMAQDAAMEWVRINTASGRIDKFIPKDYRSEIRSGVLLTPLGSGGAPGTDLGSTVNGLIP